MVHNCNYDKTARSFKHLNSHECGEIYVKIICIFVIFPAD
jgi:hypothetical protein